MNERRDADTIHASCVAIEGWGVLILGSSGAGKSDLALRLIDRGAVLVADDRCRLLPAAPDGSDARPVATAPETLAGLIEVRSIGIVTQPHVTAAPIGLAVVLDEDPPRMPDADDSIEIAGTRLPRLRLDPRSPSAPIKVELALRAARA
ncbi:MAG: aldolase [Sphingomonadales bacterium]|nr:aldolase [Sphingomonadales bacterium]